MNFFNEIFSISVPISLNFVPKDLIHNDQALVQIMAWRRIGDHPLSEPMLIWGTDAYMRHWVWGGVHISKHSNIKRARMVISSECHYDNDWQEIIGFNNYCSSWDIMWYWTCSEPNARSILRITTTACHGHTLLVLFSKKFSCHPLFLRTKNQLYGAFMICSMSTRICCANEFTGTLKGDPRPRSKSEWGPTKCSQNSSRKNNVWN